MERIQKMAKATTIDQPTGAVLETLILNNSYRERHAAYMALLGAVQPILKPHSTMGYGGSGLAHFLPIPDRPRDDDERGLRKWTAELAAITTRERELTFAAQRINETMEPLKIWSQELARREDFLLIAKLDTVDEPDVLAYIREHQRYIRTCQRAITELEIT